MQTGEAGKAEGGKGCALRGPNACPMHQRSSQDLKLSLSQERCWWGVPATPLNTRSVWPAQHLSSVIHYNAGGLTTQVSYVYPLPWLSPIPQQATFMVPRDAHMLDIVLSDVPGGEGTYDNRGGLDYHIPVEGGVGARPQPLHVCHIAVEMAPVAKVRAREGEATATAAGLCLLLTRCWHPG